MEINKSYSDSVCHQINRAGLDTFHSFLRVCLAYLLSYEQIWENCPLRAEILWNLCWRGLMLYDLWYSFTLSSHRQSHKLTRFAASQTNYWFKAVMTQAYQRSQSGVPSFMVQPFYSDEDGGCIAMETSRWWGSQMGSDWVVLCNHCSSEIIANDYWPLNSLWSNISASHSVLLKYNFSVLKTRGHR